MLRRTDGWMERKEGGGMAGNGQVEELTNRQREDGDEGEVWLHGTQNDGMNKKTKSRWNRGGIGRMKTKETGSN